MDSEKPGSIRCSPVHERNLQTEQRAESHTEITGSRQAVIYFIIKYLSSSLARNYHILLVSIMDASDDWRSLLQLNSDNKLSAATGGPPRHQHPRPTAPTPRERHRHRQRVTQRTPHPTHYNPPRPHPYTRGRYHAISRKQDEKLAYNVPQRTRYRRELLRDRRLSLLWIRNLPPQNESGNGRQTNKSKPKGVHGRRPGRGM